MEKAWSLDEVWGCHRNYPGQLERQHLFCAANWLIRVSGSSPNSALFILEKEKGRKRKTCHLSLAGPCRKQGWNSHQNWSPWEICRWFWWSQTPPQIFSFLFSDSYIWLPPISCPLLWGLFWVFLSLRDYVYIREFLLKFLSIATACPGRI